MSMKLSSFITAFTFTLAFNSADASTVCNEIKNYQPESSSLIPVSCIDQNSRVLGKLKASNRFPDVSFLGFDGTCYISDDTQAIRVTWGTRQFVLRTLSAWTNSFDTFGVPFIFGNGATGIIGTVATQITVLSPNGVNVGQIYTKDTINLSQYPAPEDDVVIAGTNFFEGAKGTIKITSVPGSDGSSLLIESIGGKLCINQ